VRCHDGAAAAGNIWESNVVALDYRAGTNRVGNKV